MIDALEQLHFNTRADELCKDESQCKCECDDGWIVGIAAALGLRGPP